MLAFEPAIRNAVYAVIVRDRRILLLRKGGDRRGERFALPGGAQDPGETLVQTLQRECREEIDTEVEILALRHVADYFKPRANPEPMIRHQIQFLFHCRIADDYRPRNGPRPDGHQIEVLWKEFADLPGLPLQPESMKPLLTRQDGTGAVYQGLFE